MYQKIDPAAWPRRELFEFFSGMSQPFYSVTFRQDVTRLVELAREERLSFYYALIWLCTHAVNEVEAFRYALEGGRQKLALSVEVNHRFVDGLHIGRFHEALSAKIAAL